ncbi:hypothetical protein XH80_01870 [Bradyrhizobium sp. CCBAU 45384]|nr:hypothetical protein [Bradyrhizobium sp. CCBAU 45384]
MLHDWVRRRAAELWNEWNVWAEISADYSFELECIIDDAIDKQARAERLAYICDRPIPDAKTALTELLGLLEWMGGGQPSRGWVPQLSHEQRERSAV